MFADDVKIFMTVMSKKEATRFQKDIDDISNFSSRVGLELKDNKFVAMGYGPVNELFSYVTGKKR
jgi:hypothetical protein